LREDKTSLAADRKKKKWLAVSSRKKGRIVPLLPREDEKPLLFHGWEKRVMPLIQKKGKKGRAVRFEPTDGIIAKGTSTSRRKKSGVADCC